MRAVKPSISNLRINIDDKLKTRKRNKTQVIKTDNTYAKAKRSQAISDPILDDSLLAVTAAKRTSAHDIAQLTERLSVPKNYSRLKYAERYDRLQSIDHAGLPNLEGRTPQNSSP